MNWWAATVGRIAGIPDAVRICFTRVQRGTSLPLPSATTRYRFVASYVLRLVSGISSCFTPSTSS